MLRKYIRMSKQCSNTSLPCLSYLRVSQSAAVFLQVYTPWLLLHCTLPGDGEDAVTFNPAKGEEVSAADEERWEDWFAEFEDKFLPAQQDTEGAEDLGLDTAVTAFMKSKGITNAYQRRGFLSRIEGSYVQVGGRCSMDSIWSMLDAQVLD
jgi:hypothetical protein